MTSSQYLLLSRLFVCAAVSLQNLGFWFFRPFFLPGIIFFSASLCFVSVQLGTANNRNRLPYPPVLPSGPSSHKHPPLPQGHVFSELLILTALHFGSGTLHMKYYQYTRTNFSLQSKSNPDICHEPRFCCAHFPPNQSFHNWYARKELAKLLAHGVPNRVFSHDVRSTRVRVFLGFLHAWALCFIPGRLRKSCNCSGTRARSLTTCISGIRCLEQKQPFNLTAIPNCLANQPTRSGAGRDFFFHLP